MKDLSNYDPKSKIKEKIDKQTTQNKQPNKKLLHGKKHLKESPKTNEKWEQSICNLYLRSKQNRKDQIPNRELGKGNEQTIYRSIKKDAWSYSRETGKFKPC